MSSISAGLTSGTALVSSGDTTGELLLKTNGTTTAVTIDTSQNVGIGTTSPSYKLEVNGGASDAISLFNSTNVNGPHLRFSASSVDKAYIGGAPGFLSSGTADDLGIRAVGSVLFATNGSGVDMTLNTSGNLGLGRSPVTYSTFKVLDVAGSAGAIQKWVHTGSTVELQAYASSTLTAIGSATNHPLLLVTNDTERARIASTGNVGIGTTDTANGRLNVLASGAATANSLFLSNIDGTYNPYLQVQHIGINGLRFLVNSSYGGTAGNINFAPAGTDSVVFNTSGFVGIGTSSPQTGLSLIKYGSQWTNHTSNTYPQPAGNTFLQMEAVAAQNNWFGFTGTYGATSGSANLLLQANLNNFNQQAGNYIASEVQSATAANLTFGKMIGGASSGANSTKSEQMRITSGGDVGIGTTGPNAKLEVTIASATSGEIARFTSPSYDSVYIAAGASATSCGIGTLSSSAFNLFVNGSSKMLIDSSGRVLIGTTSAVASLGNSTLQVGSGFSGITNTGSGANPTILTSGSLEFNLDGVSGTQKHGRILGTSGGSLGGPYSGGLSFEYYAFNGSAYQWYTGITLDSAGGVGIGTSSPAYKLEVVSGTTASGQQNLANFRTGDSTTGYNAGIQFFATASATAGSRNVIAIWDADGANSVGGDYFYIRKYGNDGNVELWQQSNADMIFSTAGTERARITNGGQFLVGTTTTSGGELARFQTSSGATTIGIIAATNGTSYVNFGDTSDANVGFIGYDHTSNFMNFRTNASEALRITSGGAVCIGTTSTFSNAGLVVDIGSGGTNRPIAVHGTGGVDGTYVDWLVSAPYGSNTTEINIIKSSISAVAGNSGLQFWISDGGGASTTTRSFQINRTSCTVVGSLSKGSGSFKIDHPLPEKTNTHHLVHSFIEGPQADLIYRGKVTLINGSAQVNIDTASGMTEGTFVLLCRDVQCFTTNESDWTAVRGSVSGNTLTIEAQDPTSTATISWMVIGERKDKHMYDTEWTDDDGKVIVEPLKTA